MNNSEGQTQEPVGGMKSIDEIFEKHIHVWTNNDGENFIAPREVERGSLSEAIKYAMEEYHNQFTPPPAPIKTGSVEVKSIQEVMNLDSFINALRHNSPPNDSLKLLQEHFWAAVDAIQKAITPPIKKEGERLSVKDVFASDKDIINAGYITDELLPCPFCGNKTVLTYGNKNEKTGNITYFVTCNRMSGCGANIFTCLGGEETADKARQEMVDTWNNRKQLSPSSPVGIDVEGFSNNVIDSLQKFYELGDETGYSNSELSRIRSCIEKVKEIKAGYAASPQSKVDEQDMFQVENALMLAIRELRKLGYENPMVLDELLDSLDVIKTLNKTLPLSSTEDYSLSDIKEHNPDYISSVTGESEAIGFAEWKDNNYIQHPNGYYSKFNDGSHGKSHLLPKFNTLSELYNLYKQ